MEIVSTSLSMSADSLMVPRQTLEELDEIIKVRKYLDGSDLPLEQVCTAAKCQSNPTQFKPGRL